jgi:hypothetical protein
MNAGYMYEFWPISCQLHEVEFYVSTASRDIFCFLQNWRFTIVSQDPANVLYPEPFVPCPQTDLYTRTTNNRRLRHIDAWAEVDSAYGCEMC